ncbi:O-antigen polymerase [Acidipropionibacterium timonense]|uniref:O-antigen polymerase n=1 Tax=Acidipropionibacterium timonense TaxID=2161818 RepID=UPI0010321FD3|nr:O-antigen polymerase [Acidipropionibacterium timonense]
MTVDLSPRRDSAFGTLCEWLLGACFVLVPVLSAWASTVTIAGLPPVRLLVVALIGLVVIRRQVMSGTSMILLVVSALWIGVGLFLVSGGAGLKELLGVVVGLLTMLSMTMAADRPRWILTLCRAWLFGLLVAILPALYEVATGRHLPNYRLGSPAWIRRTATDIASFMVNPNLFAYFMCAGMIALIIGWQLERHRLVRWMYLGTTLLCFPLIVLTGSRLTDFCLIVIMAWLLMLSRWMAVASAAVAVLAVSALVVLGKVDDLTHTVSTAIYNLSSNSGRSRAAVYLDSAWLYVSSGGIGIGPAQFPAKVVRAPWPTRGTIDPHNGFSEVITGYGTVVGAVVVALGAAVLWSTVRRNWRPGLGPLQRLLLQAVTVNMLVIPVISMSNSSYLKAPVVWAQMATVAVWCQMLCSRSMVELEASVDPSALLLKRRRVPMVDLPRHAHLLRRVLVSRTCVHSTPTPVGRVTRVVVPHE